MSIWGRALPAPFVWGCFSLILGVGVMLGGIAFFARYAPKVFLYVSPNTCFFSPILICILGAIVGCLRGRRVADERTR